MQVSRGLPVNERCLALPVPSGHLDTAAWLADSGCPLLGTLLADTLMPRGTRHQHPQVVEVQSGVDNVVGGCAVLQAHRSAHAGREAVHPCRVAGVRGRDSLTSRPWMRTLVCPVCWVGRWPMWSTLSVARTAPQRVHARFTGRLVIVTRATVSTSLLIYTAAGDWAWMRLCRSSMQLLRAAASPHCPGVSSVGCGCPCRDVACSSVIRLMLLGSTGVSLRAHRAVTRLLVSGRGCGCVRLLCSCR
jgi:hypothetical protein